MTKSTNMKFVLALLVLLPLVYADNWFSQFSHIFDLDELKSVVQQIANVIGSDATEQACEGECDNVLKHNALLTSGCDLVCTSFQTLVQRFHIV